MKMSILFVFALIAATFAKKGDLRKRQLFGGWFGSGSPSPAAPPSAPSPFFGGGFFSGSPIAAPPSSGSWFFPSSAPPAQPQPAPQPVYNAPPSAPKPVPLPVPKPAPPSGLGNFISGFLSPPGAAPPSPPFASPPFASPPFASPPFASPPFASPPSAGSFISFFSPPAAQPVPLPQPRPPQPAPGIPIPQQRPQPPSVPIPQRRPTNFISGFGAPAPASAGRTVTSSNLNGVGNSCVSNGKCLDSGKQSCPTGSFLTRKCPGPAAVKCCPNFGGGSPSPVGSPPSAPSPVQRVPSMGIPSGRKCALARPRGCSSFGGNTVTVNIQFADEMIRVNSHARNAGVRLTFTSTFRKSGVKFGAGKSRHKVGFAVDMNAGGCNSACMCYLSRVRNAGAKKFLTALTRDSTLRWGGDPNKKINWKIKDKRTGKVLCPHDSVHIQSMQYQAGADFYGNQRCLNSEFSSGRFSSFSCAGGAFLLDDAVRKADEEANAKLGGGAIAAIVICVVLVVAAVIGAVACLVRCKRAAAASSDISMSNSMYEQSARADYDSEIGGTMMVDPSSRETVGTFQCDICQKTYDYAEDLESHIAMRHA